MPLFETRLLCYRETSEAVCLKLGKRLRVFRAKNTEEDGVYAWVIGDVVYFDPCEAPGHKNPKIAIRHRISSVMLAVALHDYPNDKAAALQYAASLNKGLGKQNRKILAMVVSDCVADQILSSTYSGC